MGHLQRRDWRPHGDRRHRERHSVPRSSGQHPRDGLYKCCAGEPSTNGCVYRPGRWNRGDRGFGAQTGGRQASGDGCAHVDENLSRSILRERMLGTLSGLFGALSLILVSVGVYGVMAFQVARRQKEIGVRMALGARPLQVTGMVLAETAVPVGIGVALGLAGALGITRLAEKMLYGVTPTDPVAFAGASLVLIFLGLLAAYLPSRRAARLSPVETLRCE